MDENKKYAAVCSQCGVQTTVPFEPSEGRAIYCLDCYKSRKNGQGGGSSSHSSRDMHKAVCSSCGKETEVPFVPNPDRPVYCRDCYLKSKV